MRTTLDIDDDILRIARSQARARGVSIGRAISALARKGLIFTEDELYEEDGVPVFRVSEDAPALTVEMVRDAEIY